MEMKFVYELGPIDFQWGNLKTVAETANNALASSFSSVPSLRELRNVDNITFLSEFLVSWREAQKMAALQGWEGDFRHDPEVFWLPLHVEFVWGFVLKQDNNGTTFVISPLALPWLAHFDCYEFNKLYETSSFTEDYRLNKAELN
jgi:hypothetical protein